MLLIGAKLDKAFCSAKVGYPLRYAVILLDIFKLDILPYYFYHELLIPLYPIRNVKSYCVHVCHVLR